MFKLFAILFLFAMALQNDSSLVRIEPENLDIAIEDFEEEKNINDVDYNFGPYEAFSESLLLEAKVPEVQTEEIINSRNIEDQGSEEKSEEKENIKIDSYNTKSKKNIGEVAKEAIEHSKVLVACENVVGGCEKPSPSPKIPSVTPHPLPSLIPVVTVFPEPTLGVCPPPPPCLDYLHKEEGKAPCPTSYKDFGVSYPCIQY